MKPLITGNTEDWNGEFIFNGKSYQIEPSYLPLHGKDLKLEILLHCYPEEDIYLNSPNSYNPANYELTIGDIETFIMDNRHDWKETGIDYNSIQVLSRKSLEMVNRSFGLVSEFNN